MERLMQYIWQHRLWTPPHSATVGETDLYDVDTSDTSLFETEWVRDYDGPYVYFMNDLERVLTPTGNYLPYKGFQHFIKNHNGDIVDIVPNTDDTYWETYYPFGGMFYFGEANARYRFSGKELDRMYGIDLYDFHARHYDPVIAQFFTPDPLAEKHYHLSPYAFCAGNPVRFTDPTGMDWVSAKYGNHQFYYFFGNINGINDFNNTFGNQSNFSYLGEEYSLSLNDSSFELLADGNISLNGNMLESEISIGNTFLGSDNFMISETIGSNYYGNYLGSNNPKLKNGNDAYAIPPIDATDYVAFLHDQEYDNVGARGVIGAVVNPKAIQADLNLISRFDKNIITNSGNQLYNVGASFVFKALLPIKASFLIFYPLF